MTNNDNLINSRDVYLSMQEKLILTIRSFLETIPYGIGSAINQYYFGTIDERKIKKVELFIKNLVNDIQLLEIQLKNIDKIIFETDEFAYFFENILRRVNNEVKNEKLNALRGALVSIIVYPGKFDFDKKSHFIKSIDVFETLHIRVLQLLTTNYDRESDKRYMSFSEMCNLLKAENESDKSFVYSTFDTLANKEFIISGPVPFDREGRIDKPKQRFRATALGIDFLDFIRANQ